jgi:nitrate reductase NapE component
MNEFTSQWLIPTITNLIAGLIIWACAQVASRVKASHHTVKGVAMSATKTILPMMGNAAMYSVVFGFLVWQLRALVGADGPPSRLDAALIAFWTTWLVLLFVRLLASGRAMRQPS